MKIQIIFFKFLFILFLSSFIFFTACDLLSTYSEDEYLALGKKDKNNNGSSEIQVIVEDSDYILNNKEFFNFDDIPINERTSEIIFRIYNYGTEPLELTGDPKIIINNASDFTINQNLTSSTISPDDWTTFSITFTSSSTDGAYKFANIAIPNNSNNDPFIFTIGCTAKASGIKEFFYIGGITENWSCDYVNAIDASLHITLIGGGGGGGDAGLDGSTQRGGGGGGAGQIINFNILKDQDYTFSVLIGNGGDHGDNGQLSYINYGSNQVIANSGFSGGGGAHGGDGGDGYPRGGNSYDCNDDDYGAAGGDNNGDGGFGHEAEPGDKGNDALPNSGDGGGGGAWQRNGGKGGSGYCRIEWIGFLIP